jgi:hypothetical protein
LAISLIDASLNHGNCLNGTNSSRSAIKSQKPWGETFVTSAAEVPGPSGSDFIDVLFNQFPGFAYLFPIQAVVHRKFRSRFKPKLRFPVRMLHVHVDSRFLAREKVKPISANPQNGWTHADRIAF